jgi:hypothetical protein
VADLLAIIAHDRRRLPATDAIERLTETYEALRGPVPERHTVSTGWAVVRVVDAPTPATIGLREEDSGWTAWAGPLADPAAAGAPLGELDGQFSLARLEPDAATLRLATDPLGMKPLYVAESDGLTFASSSALVLARHLRTPPSRLGVESFLRTGSQFGQATPWEGVERLLPAEALVFTPAGRGRETYWQPTVDPAIRDLDFDATAAACVEQVSAAFGARFGGLQPWLDLTGGFDTRLLALVARDAGVDFLANTSGPDFSEDVRIARLIAATAGWPWTHVELHDDWAAGLPERIEEAVAWGDSHLDALALTEVLAGHRLKGATESVLLNGGGGEHYRDYPWGQELWAANRSTEVNFDRLVKWRVLSPLDLSPFREDPTAAVADAARRELERRAEPFAGRPNTFQCDVLYAFKSTGHFGAYQACAGGSIHMDLPFYLKSVFSTAISTAPRHRNFHRLMREMMTRLDPAIAAIETETGGPADPIRLGNANRYTPYFRRRGLRFAGRLRGSLFGTGEAAPPEPTSRDLARARLIATLRADGRLDPAQMRSAALYDPQRLTELLDRAVSAPTTVDWGLIGRLTTVELAMGAADVGLG